MEFCTEELRWDRLKIDALEPCRAIENCICKANIFKELRISETCCPIEAGKVKHTRAYKGSIFKKAPFGKFSMCEYAFA
jgi:hypothetical protein